MKVTKWWRKMAAAIIAGGAFSPAMVHAISIPLADPSFEAYTVSPHISPATGFAYADTYRPTSGWVDDLDNPQSEYLQDDVHSNWLYNTAYGEDGPPFRGTPRTGNQAMHGLAHYSAQKTTTLFAAEKIYTFSIWAQGDNDAVADEDHVFLYMFNGNVPFKETGPGTVLFQGFQGGPGGVFANRVTGSSAAQSQANWTKLTITKTLFPGDPAIGQPIGVAFYANRDAAVDDASLDVDDASNHLMILEVNTTNGQVRFRNQTGGAVKIDYYDIKSAGGALNAATWSSLQQQNAAGFPAGNGSGNGWEKAGGSSSAAIGESYLTGSSSVGNAANVGLGAAFNVTGAHDITFEYGALTGGVTSPVGDYNNNGVVDAADYVVWRDSLGQNIALPNDSTPGTVSQADYDIWRANFGSHGLPAPSTLTRGLVHYVTSFSGSGLDSSEVPEPACVVLVVCGLTPMLISRRKR
ncbi:MAG TPA: hypothetical protein VH107_16845 [Lacipirellulaceae bacterium]|jgi:hypothetical protein|nr:hypothetical protein [Lacipirellulaceae bacterium]